MKTYMAQMDIRAGNPDMNLERMIAHIEKAKSEGADLAVFPELVVGGYLLSDKWYDLDFVENLMSYNEDIRELSDGIAIAYGNVFVDKDATSEDGRVRKYNAVYVVQNKEPARRVKDVPLLPEGVQPKTLLCNYRFFDDKRYFHSTRQLAEEHGVALEELLQPFVIETKDGHEEHIGFQVCEDMWGGNDYRRNNAPLNVTKHLIDNGAKAIINISASPWTFGKNAARDRRVKFNFEDAGKGVPFLYVNNVGVQNNGKNMITFDGGTTVYNSKGDPVMLAQHPYDEEGFVIDTKEIETKPVHVRWPKNKIAQKKAALIRGIKGFAELQGKDALKTFIGMSGGLDSAINAALYAEAFGAENVFGINMPTRYNSIKGKDIAKKTADAIGINYTVIPVEDLATQQIDLLNAFDLDGTGRALSELNEENVQAKIRSMAILTNMAAKYGGIYTNNGNKLELALGYATLDGDMRGALAATADLTKVEMFELARYINEERGEEVIPTDLIPDELFRFGKDKFAPSAELKNAQFDPMKFGYHDALLEVFTDYVRKSPADILTWYKEGTLAENLHINPELIPRYGLDDPKEFVTDLEWFVKTIDLNVFKRIQSMANIVVSKSAYGFDIRESMLDYTQTRNYQQLKGELLS